MKKTVFIMLLCAVALIARAENPKYVDLGLSVRWATCNFGADSPEKTGVFDTWNEVMGTTPNMITKAYGEGWRMPTEAEWQELINGCNWSKTYVNGWECLVGEPKDRGYSNQRIYLPYNRGRQQSGFVTIMKSIYWTATSRNGYAIAADLNYSGGNIALTLDPWSKIYYAMPIRCIKTATVQAPKAVDMGHGVYWADANIGAMEDYDAGFFFAWGDVEGSRKGNSNFCWENYSYCDSAYNHLTKYNHFSQFGKVDNIGLLQNADDAADALLGSGWRMPTHAEVDTLENPDYYTWEWFDSDNSEYHGHAGYKVTCKENGNSIFLPATGYYNHQHIEGKNTYGSYWTNALGGLPYQAETMCFDVVSQCAGFGMRCEGRVIRPVKTIQ